MTLTDEQRTALLNELARASRTLAAVSVMLGQIRRKYPPDSAMLRHARMLYNEATTEYERIYKELNP